MIVTFIYKFNNNHIYYGKFVGYVSSNYNYGLNNEIKKIIYPIIKSKYRIYKSDLCVGILNTSYDNYYDCVNEKEIFDLLILEEKNIYLDHDEFTEKYDEESTEEELTEEEGEEYEVTEEDEEVTEEEDEEVTEEEEKENTEDEKVTEEDEDIKIILDVD